MAEPLSRVESTGDSIAHALREEILAGRLAAGERLVEEAIAKRYGVSRVPVREALTRLQSEGFVTIVRYRGAAVSETLIQDSRELLQIRRGLEILAAQLAAENRGGAVAGELAAFAEDQHHEHGNDGPSFHELVAAASGNRQLEEMLAGVNRRVQWGLGHNPEASTSDHRVLAIAIVNGSVMQAGYLMDEHLQRDERYFADKFDHE
ncbi:MULTISPECIES: GntR family transcriptional regulator [unclassified Mycobacterium]|uniref:GntR family transcriptional regulator n=1 Tax=unclassified Mycobacterium TaxID=2642494 RepID=UPI0029C8CA53|nr:MULTISPECIES: GntR family transcriptional regulator [unclassified Mycobacterium]